MVLKVLSYAEIEIKFIWIIIIVIIRCLIPKL
jgi:hypothetical protein